MAEQLALNDILNEKAPKEEAVQVETKETPKEMPEAERSRSIRTAHRDKEQAEQGRERDETGRYVPKAEKKEEKKEEAKVEAKVEAKTEAKPAQPELTDKEKAFLRGLQEERGKRQELERRLQAMEQAKPKEPEKKFYDDPDGALEKQRVEREREKMEIRRMLTTSRLDTAEMIARSRHADFDEVVGEKAAHFVELVRTTPGLYQQWMSARDPAEFAYTTVKRHKEIQDAGSLDALRAKIEKETRVKIEAELKEKAEKLAQERDSIPPSLSSTPSKGTNRPVWGGPTPLANILGDK